MVIQLVLLPLTGILMTDRLYAEIRPEPLIKNRITSGNSDKYFLPLKHSMLGFAFPGRGIRIPVKDLSFLKFLKSNKRRLWKPFVEF